MWWQGWKERGQDRQTKGIYPREKVLQKSRMRSDGRMEGLLIWACGGLILFHAMSEKVTLSRAWRRDSECAVLERMTPKECSIRKQWQEQVRLVSGKGRRSGDQAGDEPGQTSWESHWRWLHLSQKGSRGVGCI